VVKKIEPQNWIDMGQVLVHNNVSSVGGSYVGESDDAKVLNQNPPHLIKHEVLCGVGARPRD